MSGNNVKIEKFVLNFVKEINSNNIKIHECIYDILKSCSYYSENDILNKEMIKLYFTDEQLNVIKEKQKKLGYGDNFSRFVRYALFEYYTQKNNIKIEDKFFGELINLDKFKQLSKKCKNELINGEYTSYDIDLLRNNEKYEGKISINKLNILLKDEPYNLDFLECDILSFLVKNFEKGKIYSDLMGLSTNQTLSKTFITKENEENLEPFTDYENIVPDTNTVYYLYIYYAFVVDSNEKLDLETVFDETDEHITFLLEKYTFEKILKYNKDKYNITDINMIFDEKCLEYLKSNKLINFDEVIESDEKVESDENVEFDIFATTINNVALDKTGRLE